MTETIFQFNESTRLVVFDDRWLFRDVVYYRVPDDGIVRLGIDEFIRDTDFKTYAAQLRKIKNGKIAFAPEINTVYFVPLTDK